MWCDRSSRKEAQGALGACRRDIYSDLGEGLKGFPEELMPEPIMKGTQQYKKGLEKSEDGERKTSGTESKKAGVGACVCGNESLEKTDGEGCER